MEPEPEDDTNGIPYICIICGKEGCTEDQRRYCQSVRDRDQG